ncbi:MAG: phospho-N-acetylmuramoyl-pentapeptide-transferase [Clostridiales bacterium]|jgi:phospho-N-acetylmuramoyl-pentapeptide-transferase|nr:phospho-N-acetylmuramoyl-pentapeptide-transferase [Clostridiales bacterium]
MNYSFLWFLLSFLCSVVFGIILIPFLSKLKFGQSILNIGPSWHKNKSGTPTMGGLIFVFSMIALFLIALNTKFCEYFEKRRLILVFGISLFYASIGFLDDFIKIKLKRNLGLKSLQKFNLQLVASVVFLVYGIKSGIIDTDIIIPFYGMVDIGFLLFIPFSIFVIVGSSNAVNLTDGIDGLATSIALIVGIFFFFVSKIFLDLELSFLSLILIGSLFGFLLFNKNPAKVFMGDTGSLFLGGYLSSVAILTRLPFFLAISGIIFIAETMSVIIQVTSFKLTGKRIFKMSPLHHHLEMIGYSEKKIVLLFCFITLLTSAAAWFLILKFC